MSALDGWIDIFRTGTHTDSSGEEDTWSEDDLEKGGAWKNHHLAFLGAAAPGRQAPGIPAPPPASPAARARQGRAS